MAFLQIANIETLYFDRIYALHGLTLEIKEKEIFAVLGPNGAGKTTLLKTIAGLLKDQPKKGSIEFDGRRIHRLPPEKVSSLGIVYVPEDRGLFRELTVRENLELGCWGRHDTGDQRRSGFYLRLVPHLKGTHPPAVGNPVRRRTADAGHRPGHPATAAAADAG